MRFMVGVATDSCSPCFRGEKKGPHRVTLDADLPGMPDLLAADLPLEPRHRDHALTGDWKDYRDCHLEPDLVLIYQIHQELSGMR
ncbi:MAG: type II toxin-antitoxin system YafQ family toxin [Azoarcus sp.]|jgi:mRNA interferase YafQ|nr:type II toxin-antitoxin system YafQ family toxin [Azoarcus sp.]